ncbi:MAG: DNA-processing protein DprA [Gemmatimonadales bacterium]
MGEVRALLMLDALPGVGLVRLKRLVEAFGSAERAIAAPTAELERIAGRGTAVGLHDRSLGAAIDTALGIAARRGMEICTWSSADYPRALLHLHDPPPVLFLLGRRDLLSTRIVTVVGARRATARSRDVAERLGGALARARVTVASGLALGIDAAAHRGALGARGDTIAVMGRGADEAYPPGHRRLFRQIAEEGLIVSEFLPGTPPLPHHFPRRNRILAGLAHAVVVVEAAATSGSLITVDHALDLGIEVWAVPGPIETAVCEGSNRLLADGARPLVSVAGFVRAVTGVEAGEQMELEMGQGPAGRVLAQLGAHPLGVDQVATEAHLPVAEALALLTAMELEGLVRQLPGMRFERVA